MTSPKQMKYRRKNVKIIFGFYLSLFMILFAQEKFARFKNCILGAKKSSSLSIFHLDGENLFWNL